MDANAEKKTLTRRQMVGAVLVRVSGGMTLSAAIGEVVNFGFSDGDGREVRRKRRTLYRWVADFRKEGIEGLKPRRALRRRHCTEAFSHECPGVIGSGDL